MDTAQDRATSIRARWLLGLLLILLVALCGRLIFINAVHGPRLAARLHKQTSADIPIKARRGLIVDHRGRIIAATTLRRSVFADPKILKDKQEAARILADILDLNAEEIIPDLMAAGERRFFVIKRGITKDQAREIRAADIYGLGIFTEPYRTYPMGPLAGSLVGFVSMDGTGVSGIEHQCNHWLSGENGSKTIVRDSKRKAFWLAEDGYRPARDGYHVSLTIDAEMQAFVERELADGVNRFDAESGIAIVMHPQTGMILAMANHPGFDPNFYRDYPAERYRNRALTDPYEPGSTFKPFVAAAALEENETRMGEMFDCEGGEWTEGRRTLRDHHPYEFLTFEEILIKSSNIGMGKLGLRLGHRRLNEYIRRFGFGRATDVGLIGESDGLLRPLVRWNDFTTTSLPMGQEIAVTPLQLVRAFAVFCNGGKLVTPYVIRGIVDANGRVLRDMAPAPSDDPILSQDTLAKMRHILVEVVNRSSRADQAPATHQVFGKTGTAQIARSDGRGYEDRAYVSSFVAGVPAADPQLVVYVAVRRPDASIGYYGGQVAAPVVYNIVKRAVNYLGIPPDKDGTRIESTVMSEEVFD